MRRLGRRGRCWSRREASLRDVGYGRDLNFGIMCMNGVQKAYLHGSGSGIVQFSHPSHNFEHGRQELTCDTG